MTKIEFNYPSLEYFHEVPVPGINISAQTTWEPYPYWSIINELVDNTPPNFITKYTHKYKPVKRVSL